MAPSKRSPSPLRPRGLATCAAAATLTLLGPGTAAAQSTSDTRAQIDQQRAKEQALSGQVGAFTTLMNRMNGDIAVLARRESALEADLAMQRRVLAKTERELRRERARLAALRRRLAHSRAVLARRLTETYKAGEPDLVTVVLTSRGFTDLLERGEFLKRIQRQDRVVISSVRTARDGAQRTTRRLGVLERRQQGIAAAISEQHLQVAGTRAVLARRQAGIAQARAARVSALRATAARRGELEGTLARLQAAQPDAGQISSNTSSGPALSPGSRWAIPWYIVNCESGGRNWSPNGAGASGYYQIIPSTWQAFGGRGPAAHLAPKAEQDRVAARIYRGGAGAGNWVCA